MSNTRARNRRVSNTRQRKQQQLLEVTVRHDVAVSQRNRTILAFSFKFLLIAGLGIGAYVGGKTALKKFLWENPDYFLSDLRISTDGAITREQIVSAGGITMGSNIFKIDLAKAREGLIRLPQAERVEIQRVLPNRLNVTINERRPLAWVCAKGETNPLDSEKSFLIDAHGIVMHSKTVLPEYLHMPVITGVEMDNLAAGQRVHSLEMQAALELVRLNADSTRFQARLIDISKGYCLKVLSQTRSEITFGLDRVDLQLERLNRLLDHLEPSHRGIQTVNLLVERNMPVTFVDPVVEPDDASEVPSAKVEPAKPPAAKQSAQKNASGKSGSSKKEPAPKVKKESASPTRRKSEAPRNLDSIRKPFRANG
ncbi:MAG: Cell division protein FtsQ [Chthoniobacteraceae bacterium]|nr:Cell division protein FtsQ [Chthoniobacteraceae bacterium]